MKMKTHLKLGLSLMMLIAAPVVASAQEARIYAYQTENFCPAGLQPVTISGVICCGTPNQNVSYIQVMQHPVPHKKVHKVRRVRTEHIPTGKGLGD